MVYFELLHFGCFGEHTEVSILVLMDGVLREFLKSRIRKVHKRFNPCSNGWCTSSVSHAALWQAGRMSFNPCSNGWCTSSLPENKQNCAYNAVSILVLMDGVLRDTGFSGKRGNIRSFNPCSNGWCTSRKTKALKRTAADSFNPCSNGWCTSSYKATPENYQANEFQSLF